MKALNFNSPFAVVGLAAAILLFIGSRGYDFTPTSNVKPVFTSLEEVDMYGARPRAQAELYDQYVVAAEVANFRDTDKAFFGSDSPCFEVTIDPTVAGADTDYRLDLFGGNHLSATEVFTTELSAALSESFTEETWARDAKCFAGTFVASFTVTETGQLGDNMLVHHLRGSSGSAALAVLDVLRDMNNTGHRWHEGDMPAGEVRIPVRFKLMD